MKRFVFSASIKGEAFVEVMAKTEEDALKKAKKGIGLKYLEDWDVKAIVEKPAFLKEEITDEEYIRYLKLSNDIGDKK